VNLEVCYLKIGEFSKLTNIPVKTIRYYAEIGLLNPKEVGYENNYRYYDNEQFIELNRILALKEAGFTLREITEMNKRQIPKEKLLNLLIEKLSNAKKEAILAQIRIGNLQERIKNIKYKEDKLMKVKLDELTPGTISQNSVEFIDEGLRLQFAGDERCYVTPCEYSLPVKINLKAKTDSTNIRLYYGRGEVIFNWECAYDELRVHDIKTGQPYGYNGFGKIPIEEFVDITWIITKEGMEIYVNDEERLKSSDFPYVKMIKENANIKISAPVRVGSAWGSIVTIKNLEIIEM